MAPLSPRFVFFSVDHPTCEAVVALKSFPFAVELSKFSESLCPKVANRTLGSHAPSTEAVTSHFSPRYLSVFSSILLLKYVAGIPKNGNARMH